MFEFFRKAKQAERLEKEVNELRDQLYDAKTKVQHATIALQDANTATAQARDELARLKANLREQNEADLLLVSQRIAKRIMDGEKKEALTHDLSMQSNLLASQQAMGMSWAQSPWHGGGNTLAGLMGWHPH